jgi:hypothetical protein
MSTPKNPALDDGDQFLQSLSNSSSVPGSVARYGKQADSARKDALLNRLGGGKDRRLSTLFPKEPSPSDSGSKGEYSSNSDNSSTSGSPPKPAGGRI